MYRISLVVVLGFVVAACGGKPTATETPDNAAEVVTTETDPAAGQVATLLTLENGDRACYVGVRLADGTETSLEGDFALCAGGARDATALIGQQVTYTTEQGHVLAAACEGNIDCGKSDQVELVTTITVAP